MMNSIKHFLISEANAKSSVMDRLNNVSADNYNTESTSLASTIGTLISIGLSMLGVVFVILVISAGYKWMMASGDAKKVDEAKDTLWRAVIGLVITISAYVIQQYVFSKI